MLLTGRVRAVEMVPETLPMVTIEKGQTGKVAETTSDSEEAARTWTAPLSC